jgi:hypothetical protein
MPHGRLAPPDRPGDLRYGSAMLDEWLQIRTRETPFGGKLVAVDSAQPMFLDPITHRGFVQLEPPANLSERQPLA